MVESNIIDDFRSVCADNVRALKNKQTVFAYKDDVLDETKRICAKLGIKLKITYIDGYYIIRNVASERKDKFYGNGGNK